MNRKILPSAPLSESEVAEMLLQVRQRRFAAEAARGAAEERRLHKSSKPHDEKAVGEQLSLVRLLYEARKLGLSEYLFHCAFLVGTVHDARWLAGAYEQDLGPISERLTEIERSHGLKPDESFYRDDAPPEWLDLNSRYEAVLDLRFGETIVEFGLSDVAKLWLDDRDKFDQLREAGRVATMEETNAQSAVTHLVALYEREAERAAAGGAYVAATLMLASAAESRILLHALRRPDAAQVAVERTSGKLKPRVADPLSWNSEQIFAVADSGGWLHNLPHEELVTALGEWLGSLLTGRHPLRTTAGISGIDVGENEFAAAASAYRALRYSLDYAAVTSDPSATLQ